MPWSIEKEFHFSASHQLTHLPEGHKCSRLHGHSYRVKVVLSGPLDDRGFVFDYGDLKPFKEYIDTHLDHRHLNEVFALEGHADVSAFLTTAENLALHLFRVAQSKFGDVVSSVGVSETEKTWAWYAKE